MKKFRKIEDLKQNSVKRIKAITFVLIVSLMLAACGAGKPPSVPSLTATPSDTPTPIPTSTVTPTLTASPFPTPKVYETLNVNDFGWYTVYWDKTLWQSALSANGEIEDFELDQASYGELSFPYLTGHGLLFDCGECSAQIFNDPTLLASGNLLHFRSWGSGMRISFPDDSPVNAFGFNYVTPEKWQLLLGDATINLKTGRPGFIGVIFSGITPDGFTLSSMAKAQGGLTMDNLTFVRSESVEPTSPPLPGGENGYITSNDLHHD